MPPIHLLIHNRRQQLHFHVFVQSHVGSRVALGVVFVNMLEDRGALRLVNVGGECAWEAGIEHILDCQPDL